MRKCIVPISGGLDSSVILHHAIDIGYEPHAVSFNYGQRHLHKELACAEKTCKKLKVSHVVLDLSFFKQIVTTSALTSDQIQVAKTKDILGDPQTVNYVPNRNMMMLSICCAYAESVGADTVFHGSALVDSQAGYWDGSKEFVQSINSLLQLNRRDRVTIQAPLIELSKQQIIQRGVELDVDFADTWTCYEGLDHACGECPACSSRIKGFLDAGYIDPITYNRKDIPWKQQGAKEL